MMIINLKFLVAAFEEVKRTVNKNQIRVKRQHLQTIVFLLKISLYFLISMAQYFAYGQTVAF